MAVNIHAVADYFILKADAEAGDPITHLKLQKLLYYAQAWHLAIGGEELVKDEFEAWVHGPVARAIYERFQGKSWQPLSINQLATDPAKELNDDMRGFLDEVWDIYGQFGAKRLEVLTHSEAPWKEARAGLSPIERCEKPISKETMKKFYGEQLKDGEQQRK